MNKRIRKKLEKRAGFRTYRAYKLELRIEQAYEILRSGYIQMRDAVEKHFANRVTTDMSEILPDFKPTVRPYRVITSD